MNTNELTCECGRVVTEDFSCECVQANEPLCGSPQKQVDQSAAAFEPQPAPVVQDVTETSDREARPDQSAAFVPKGYRKIQLDVYTDGRRFLIMEQEAMKLLDDTEFHSCDLMGCAFEHVIARLTIDGIALRDKSL